MIPGFIIYLFKLTPKSNLAHWNAHWKSFFFAAILFCQNEMKMRLKSVNLYINKFDSDRKKTDTILPAWQTQLGYGIFRMNVFAVRNILINNKKNNNKLAGLFEASKQITLLWTTTKKRLCLHWNFCVERVRASIQPTRTQSHRELVI